MGEQLEIDNDMADLQEDQNMDFNAEDFGGENDGLDAGDLAGDADGGADGG